MRIGVLGTGDVGQTLATKLCELGHEVRMGSREAGNEKAVAWAASVAEAGSEGTFADAAKFGELAINATAGHASLAALEAAGAENLAGKVLLDVANPLDFSGGFPPTLSFVNDTSLAEEIQTALPEARVVKALNTLHAGIMISPAELPEATDLFLCGNDAGAKRQVAELLESFGWEEERIRDLGEIAMARGTEMYVALWVRLLGALGGPTFNIRIVSA